MKKLPKFLALLPALLLMSWISTSNEVTSIRWTSDQYKDLETGDMIQMTNEFECTPEGLSWSLLDGDLPVSAVVWNLDEEDQGFIKYSVNTEDVKGTITFFIGTNSRAETDLKSNVGKLRFKFQFRKDQQTFSTKESLSLIEN